MPYNFSYEDLLKLAQQEELPNNLYNITIDQSQLTQINCFATTGWKRREAAKDGLSASSSGESSDWGGLDENGDEDDDTAWQEWQEELKRIVKEMEEMKELEKAADDLQTQADQEAPNSDESDEEKRERVRRELEKVAKEQAERRATANLMFELGQKAYGKGMYSRAIEFLEASLTIIPGPTLLGGEIQIWLAMAYEANNRHKDCIELYKDLEKQHPSINIRRQAAELRYILQAPKLKITKDEMVTIPLIGSSYDWYAGTWTDKYKDQDMKRRTGKMGEEMASSQDYFGDFFLWRPPSGWEKNRNLWAIVTLWFCLVATALYLQR
ncbi:Tetratricopeptide repeat-like superfamily protein [Rhynchospora pubera]|uniref:Tetratricopeptide repeat-like superfamily protein n=1 Tax=Rhynchospora pubera TaxID=906938 RepID=A0AAV8EH43_9POAL|nr:Tetratricopeptide repeat-like superfamily protein [Rhynchospora pubera]